MFAATTSPWYLPTWVSGQRPVTSPIAHSVLRRAQVRVDRDAVGVGLDADGLEAEPVDPRSPAGGDEQPVAAQLAPVVELEDVVVAVAPRGGHARGQRELDAVAAQDLAERLAERRGLPGEHVLGPVDHDHLAAEPAHGLRHLDPDRPAAQDEQAARDGLHGGRLAAGPDARRARAGPGRAGRSARRRSRAPRGRRCGARRRPRRRPGRRAGRCRAAGRCRCRPASAPARRRSSPRP